MNNREQMVTSYNKPTYILRKEKKEKMRSQVDNAKHNVEEEEPI